MGAACAVPDSAAKTKTAIATANSVRNMTSLLFCFGITTSDKEAIGPRSNEVARIYSKRQWLGRR